MKENKFLQTIGRKASMASLKLRKRSPEMLVVTGVIGFVVSGVLACKATLKVNDILDEAKDTVDKIHECKNDETFKDKYTDKDSTRDLVTTYGKTALKLAKLYAPALLVGASSITCIFVSNNIMHKRNIAVMAAYATLEKGFEKYRANVIEKYGKEADFEFLNNIKAKTIKEKRVDEGGNEIEVEKTINTIDAPSNSEFTRLYDDGNFGWTKDPEHNLYFLISEQNWANDKLRSQGYLFLNEIFRRLGYKETPAGQVTGWLYKPDDNEYQGDNYVDFGILNMNDECVRTFLEGDERSIWLNFNVDGIIYDKI